MTNTENSNEHEAVAKPSMHPASGDNYLVDENEAAAQLGLKAPTLRRWRWEGRGPAYHVIGGRAIRYEPAAIRAYKDAARREFTSDP